MPDDQDPRTGRPEDEDEADAPQSSDEASEDTEDTEGTEGTEGPVAADGVDEDAFEDDVALETTDEQVFLPLATPGSNDEDEDDVDPVLPLGAPDARAVDYPGTPLAWGEPEHFEGDSEDLALVAMPPPAPLFPGTTDAGFAEHDDDLDDSGPAGEDGPDALLYTDASGAALEADEAVVEAVDEYLDEEEEAYEAAYEETPADLPPLVPRIAIEPAAPTPMRPVPYAPPLPADLEPMVPLVPTPEGDESSAESDPDTGPRPFRRHAIPINPLVVVMTAVGTAICLGFLLIEPSPRWLLLAGAIAVIFGMDGVLRGTWGEPFTSEGDTTPYLFLPALYILAGPMLVEHNVPGYAAIPAGLLLGAGFGVIVVGELISVRTGAPEYPIARLIETVASYFVLFALISLTYVFEINLGMALLAVAILTAMLGIEVLRQGEIDPLETLLLAIVSALILVEARWMLHYLPLDGYLAGLTLTLVFFLTTGLLHAYVERQFDNGLVLEYTTIAAAGIALVVAARVTGLA